MADELGEPVSPASKRARGDEAEGAPLSVIIAHAQLSIDHRGQSKPPTKHWERFLRQSQDEISSYVTSGRRSEAQLDKEPKISTKSLLQALESVCRKSSNRVTGAVNLIVLLCHKLTD